MGRCEGNCALNKRQSWFGGSPAALSRARNQYFYKGHLTSSTFALCARRALGTFRVGKTII